MTEINVSMYECRPSTLDMWRQCFAPGCGNERRINPHVDQIRRLQHYKEVLDKGWELGQLEQDDLEAIAKEVVETLQRFAKMLVDAFTQVAEQIAPVIKSLYDSLPESAKSEVRNGMSPAARAQFDPRPFFQENQPHSSRLDRQLRMEDRA